MSTRAMRRLRSAGSAPAWVTDMDLQVASGQRTGDSRGETPEPPALVTLRSFQGPQGGRGEVMGASWLNLLMERAGNGVWGVRKRPARQRRAMEEPRWAGTVHTIER